MSKDCNFKCDGLLGSLLKLSNLLGISETDLRKYDEEWNHGMTDEFDGPDLYDSDAGNLET